MTPETLRKYLERLNLSQNAAAKAVGVTGRSMRRWCRLDSDDGPFIPFAHSMILHNMLAEQCKKDGTECPNPPVELREKLTRREEAELYRAMDSGINTVTTGSRSRRASEAQ